VEDIRQWEVRDCHDIVCIKVVAKLPRSDEYSVKYFLNRWVTNLRLIEDFANKVNWSLQPKGMAFLLSFHQDCRADDMSCHGDVE
jgi:hypothetical protein